ncbi:MAG: hypothetical protein AB7O44_29240 [Hyphomicrobiaceae bacterium]
MTVDHHIYSLETDVRDGVSHVVLVIETDIPLPPQTPIDKDNLPLVVSDILKGCVDKGWSFDEIRVVHRTGGT